MRDHRSRQAGLKAHQLTLPFPGWGRRRADNDDDVFASGTRPTRGVFNGDDVGPQTTKFRGGLTLADFTKRVGSANDYPEGYRR